MANDVQFQEWRPPKRQPEPSKMARVLMKFSGGLIKTERRANFVLVMILIAVVIATILVLVFGGSKPARTPIPPAGGFPQTNP